MNVMCNVWYAGTLPPEWGSAVAFQSMSELSVAFNRLSGQAPLSMQKQMK